jgi:DNA repair protein RadC
MEKKAIEYTLNAKKSDFVSAKIRCSSDAYSFAKKFYHEDILIYESAFLMMINNAGVVVGYAKISQGGCFETTVDMKIVCKYAIDSLSSGVIFVHNHPSGNLMPSYIDDDLMRRMKESLNFFGIKLLDSLILTDGSYYSYADECRMDF